MLHTSFRSVADSTYPPVVLIHGFSTSAEEDFVQSGLVAALNAAGRSTLVIDLPGHGQSAPVASSAAGRTDQVLREILRAIAASPVPGATSTGEFDLLGYSLGARLAWELPALSPAVRRVVLGGLSPVDPFGMVDSQALQRALAGNEPEHPLLGVMVSMITAPSRDTVSLTRLIEGLGDEPFDPSRGGPTVPALFVSGAEDPLSEGIDEIALSCPNAILKRVAGNHYSALRSSEFASEVVRFLEG